MYCLSLHLLLPGLFDDVEVLGGGVKVGVGVEQVCHEGQIQLLVAIFDVLNVGQFIGQLPVCLTLGVTNCLQPILSACSSITPALSTRSLFCIADLFTPAVCKSV